MFKKVLIAEDHESASISVRKTLEDFGVHPRFAYYCDDALLSVRKAIAENEPYELLITDLSFDEDDRPQKLLDGRALIRAARELQPGLKVLVFSAEGKAAVIESLFEELAIDGYVRKARRDATELKAAIELLFRNRGYRPPYMREAMAQKNSHDFTDVDIEIIKLLSVGVLQKEIPDHLTEKKLKPAGLSSVEKRLGLMKSAFDFTKNEQLVIMCRDLGLI